MAEFNIAELMKGVSRADTGREQISYLPHGQIFEDAANGYSMDGIGELARSIEIVGLQQPLRVRPIEGLAGGYRIISGHRRFAAVTQLIEQGSQRFADGVPCIIDSAAASDALRELQLLLGNADNRKMSAADEAQQAERISDCLRRLEDEGYKFPGRHRDWVSKLSGLSRSKIGRLEAIKKNLMPALFDRFNDGLLGVTTAYRISQESQEIQTALFRQCGGIHSYGLLNSLNEQELENEIAKCKAPPQKEPPQATLAPEVTRSSFDSEKYLAERAEEDNSYRRMLISVCMEFIKAVPASCPRNEAITKLKTRFSHSGLHGPNMVCYDGSPKGLSLSRTGKKPVDNIFRTWTEVYDMLAAIAFELASQSKGPDEEDNRQEISLKYLGWLVRSAPDGVKCWAKFMDEYTTRDFTMMATYDAETDSWYCGDHKNALSTIDQKCRGWWPLPEENAPDLPADLMPQPVPGPDTKPTWHTGEPEAKTYYAVKLELHGKPLVSPRVLWWDGSLWCNAVGDDIRQRPIDAALRVTSWYPLPKEDEK